MKKIIYLSIIILIVLFLILVFQKPEEPTVTASNFEECVTQGYPVLESYPRQCRTPDDKTFVEDIGNEVEKLDLIRTSTPRPNSVISSPLQVKGEARGFWFFEGDFPIRLLDDDGNELGIGFVSAKSDWMTEDFVGFEGKLEFETPITEKGTLILEKDNPSGLPEHADQLMVPVRFSEL
jgi:hypothetical protein